MLTAWEKHMSMWQTDDHNAISEDDDACLAEAALASVGPIRWVHEVH